MCEFRSYKIFNWGIVTFQRQEHVERNSNRYKSQIFNVTYKHHGQITFQVDTRVVSIDIDLKFSITDFEQLFLLWIRETCNKVSNRDTIGTSIDTILAYS